MMVLDDGHIVVDVCRQNDYDSERIPWSDSDFKRIDCNRTPGSITGSPDLLPKQQQKQTGGKKLADMHPDSPQALEPKKREASQIRSLRWKIISGRDWKLYRRTGLIISD